jgi:hypothetical protein
LILPWQISSERRDSSREHSSDPISPRADQRFEQKVVFQKKWMLLLLVILGPVISLDANARCDVGQARAIHAQSNPFNSLVATGMLCGVAPGGCCRRSTTSTPPNQTYVNLLSVALATDEQMRVAGNAAACPDAGILHAAGSVVGVFMDIFQ